jgi:hypothetical protein
MLLVFYYQSNRKSARDRLCTRRQHKERPRPIFEIRFPLRVEALGEINPYRGWQDPSAGLTIPSPRYYKGGTALMSGRWYPPVFTFRPDFFVVDGLPTIRHQLKLVTSLSNNCVTNLESMTFKQIFPCRTEQIFLAFVVCLSDVYSCGKILISS